MAKIESGGMVWVMGKTEPGWYCAKQVWDNEYVADLRAMGYQVERFKPEVSA